MPSSEDMIQAQNDLNEQVVNIVIQEGHPERSAREIVKRMSQDEKIQKVEKATGKPIYRGPYSSLY